MKLTVECSVLLLVLLILVMKLHKVHGGGHSHMELNEETFISGNSDMELHEETFIMTGDAMFV